MEDNRDLKGTAQTHPDEEEEELPVLEEQVEPPSGEPAALPEGSELIDAGGCRYRVGRILERGDIRRYAGEALPEDRAAEPVIIYQAISPPAQGRLERVFDMISSVGSPMLPAVRAEIKDEQSAYLIFDDPASPTLAEAFASEIPLARLLNVLAQVAAGVSKMHEAGWLHLGLRPEGIYLSKPVKLFGLEYICRAGEKSEVKFHIPGYSAPELIFDEPPDVRSDVYSLGALLYRGVTGAPIAETGAEMSTWKPPKPMPGVPQILAGSLGEWESRYPSMTALHRALLDLSGRLLPRPKFSIAAATTIGLEPTRTTNQDAYGYLCGVTESDPGAEGWAVACVADGMGGMAAGEVASRAAVKAVQKAAAGWLEEDHSLPPDEQVTLVKEWMARANERVVSEMESRRVRGGCTMVIAFITGTRLAIAHVGDCRLYLIRGEEVSQLTQDHSLAQALVAQGQIRMDEVRHHPERNMVTRSLGERQPLPEYFIDTLQQMTGKTTMELAVGDIVLLASDGLWEPVTESEMLRAIKEHSPDLDGAAGAMISLALERGAPDNATLLLLRIGQVSAFEED